MVLALAILPYLRINPRGDFIAIDEKIKLYGLSLCYAMPSAAVGATRLWAIPPGVFAINSPYSHRLDLGRRGELLCFGDAFASL